MTRWIDSGEWDPVGGPQLEALLASTITDPAELERLVDNTGIARARLRLNATNMLVLWHDLLFDLCRTGDLRRFLTTVADSHPALRQGIDDLDTPARPARPVAAAPEVAAGPARGGAVPAPPGRAPDRAGPDSSDQLDDPDFFISYTRQDQPWAEWIAVVLEQTGYRVLLQAWHSGPGNFVSWMEDAVREARFVLPVLSSAYLTSRWSQLEWTAFMRQPETVVPVRIEDFESRSLLATQDPVNLVGLAEEAAILRLQEVLKRAAGPPTRPPRSPASVGFPGEITRLVPDVSDEPAADQPPERIASDVVEVVFLGVPPDGVSATELATAFGVEPARLHDLSEAGPEPLDRLAEVLSTLPGTVSDLLVVVAGPGRQDQDVGIALPVGRTGPDQPPTQVGLRTLFDPLIAQLAHRRVHLLLDVTRPDGESIVISAQYPLPVLNLRERTESAAPHRGLTGLLAELRQPPEQLAARLRHWRPLGLGDLAHLSGSRLLAPPGWTAEVELVPNPLGWPRGNQADSAATGWCFVLSAADRADPKHPIEISLKRLEAHWADQMQAAARAVDASATLGSQAGRCCAAEVLAAPALFARAIEQVCGARIAVFDVTNYEPAVMILLGIRAVIRRGVTLCVHRKHDEPWQRAEAPFHLREVSLIEIKEPTATVIGERLLAGLRQLGEPGRGYRDLPSFDLVRAVPPEQQNRKPRPFDRGRGTGPPQPEDRGPRPVDGARQGTILALVPFDPGYQKDNWTVLRDNIVDAARAVRASGADSTDERPEILRSLDLHSPRVVSEQLYEAMRLTDFCLVDASGARPNVMFELGVRLAANALHPIVVHDPEYPRAEHPPSTSGGAAAQSAQLRALLDVITYRPYSESGAYKRMVARHIELRQLATRSRHPRAATVLGGFPPTGVFDLAWRFADARDERFAVPVGQQLRAEADAMMIDPSDGARRLIYPKRHPLSELAEASGRERLIAAWLYLRFRRSGADRDEEAAPEGYGALTDRLIDQLRDTGDEADAELADRIEEWRGDEP